MNFANFIFISGGVFYIIYTMIFALHFNKEDYFYTEKQKLRHNIMIWLIPFLWIIILKTIRRPPKKQLNDNNTPYNDWYDDAS